MRSFLAGIAGPAPGHRLATGLSSLFRHERLPGPCLDGCQVIWQYEWCKRTWVDFLPAQNLVAEHAFQNGLPGVSVLGDGHGKDGVVPIELDFSSMTQKGKVERRICRVAILQGAE